MSLPPLALLVVWSAWIVQALASTPRPLASTSVRRTARAKAEGIGQGGNPFGLTEYGVGQVEAGTLEGMGYLAKH